MSFKVYLSLILVITLSTGVFVYGNTGKEIKRSNALYLQGMIAGSVQLQEQNYTEWFHLQPNQHYQQHILLDNGKTIDHTGSWTLPLDAAHPLNAPDLLDAPDSLRYSDIVLHNAINTPTSPSSELNSAKFQEGFDYRVPASEFYNSHYETHRWKPIEK
jgi:hypothetical protein